MGARLLRNWICQPLKNIEKIKERHDIVEELTIKNEIRNQLREKLEEIYDIQRIATKINNNTATPRDYISLKNSLYKFSIFLMILLILRSRFKIVSITPLSIIIPEINKNIFKGLNKF